MQKEHKVVLVNGSYNATDSRELLHGLINYKRNFHTLKNFSSELRTGKPDEFAMQRRNELAHSVLEVQEMYDQALEEGLEFKIDCSIEIKLSKPEAISEKVAKAEV